MRRPPSILYRLLVGDLLRLLGITTLALVAIIAFAGAIKPLADGRLSLDQALRFMGLLAIPMAQFALPFAAGFSATIVYHRFASDNEAMAASVAGLGHKALLTPALVLGLSLSAILGVLSFEVIPPVLREAQKVLVTDGTRLLVSQLNRGESVRLSFGGSDAVNLYADGALPPERPKPGTRAYETGASRIIVLEGVLAEQARAEGEPLYASAERVYLLVYDGGDDGTSITLRFENATGYVSRGSESEAEVFTVGPLRLPSALVDDPKFLTWGAMDEALRRPRALSKTDSNARVLAARLGERDAMRRLEGDFELRDGARFFVSTEFESDAGETLEVEGARLVYDPHIPELDPNEPDPERAKRRALRDRTDRWRVEPVDGAEWVRVVRIAPTGPALTHLARHAWIELPIEQAGREERVTRARLVLEDVVSLDGVRSRPFSLSGSEPSRAQLVYPDLLPEGFRPDILTDLPVKDLLVRAENPDLKDSALTAYVETVARDLRTRVDEQAQEIFSKRQERLAFSAACCVMVLVGATIALRMRESLPLPVYLWSFLPALGCIITIGAGQRLVHRNGAIGLVVLWGGVAALFALFVFHYSRLRRH